MGQTVLVLIVVPIYTSTYEENERIIKFNIG